MVTERNMTFSYKTVLVIGATSGIGLALAEKMIENGSHVIAVGRRQENLDSFIQKYGNDKASTIKFDITNLAAIPAFVEQVKKDHVDLDCVLLNSGIQRPLDFTNPEEINLDVVGEEFTTNYLSYIYLTTHLLPVLQRQSGNGVPSSLIFVTSGLALIPILRCPGYCASKAAMHQLILCLREQLRGDEKFQNVKIVEILPPAVQTELHDAKHQPNLRNGSSMGMPLEEFTEKAWHGLVEGKEDIPVGAINIPYQGWEKERQKTFRARVEQMRKNA